MPRRATGEQAKCRIEREESRRSAMSSEGRVGEVPRRARGKQTSDTSSERRAGDVPHRARREQAKCHLCERRVGEVPHRARGEQAKYHVKREESRLSAASSERRE